MTSIGRIEFKSLGKDNIGYLTPIEASEDIPFAVERIYYIYGVPADVRRGFHSHKDLKQVLICLNGSVDILCKTPYEEETVTLDKPNIGLFIGEMVWREMFNFSEGAVLMVLASRHFDENDYLRNYEQYINLAVDYFGGNK